MLGLGTYPTLEAIVEEGSGISIDDNQDVDDGNDDGKFTLLFGGVPSEPIAFDAAEADVNIL